MCFNRRSVLNLMFFVGASHCIGVMLPPKAYSLQTSIERRKFRSVENVIVTSLGDKRWLCNIPGGNSIYHFMEGKEILIL